MRGQQLVIDTFNELNEKKVFPEIEAVLIGGSLGRKDTDKFSDIDLFLLIRQPYLKAFCATGVKKLAAEFGSVELHTGPIYTPNFGQIYTAFYDKDFIGQFILNDSSTLTPNPMNQSKGMLIFDNTGYYTDYLAKAKDTSVDRDEAFTAAYSRYFFRILGVWKEVERGNLWLSIRFLQDATEQLMIMRRLATGAYPPGNNFHKCAKSLERDLGSTFCEDLSKTLCAYDMSSIRKACGESVRICRAISRSFVDMGDAPPLPEMTAAEPVFREMEEVFL